MKLMLAFILLLLSVIVGATPTQKVSPPAPDPKKIVTALYQLETAASDLMQGNNSEQDLDAQVKLLSKGNAEDKFAGLDKDLAASVSKAWDKWQESRKVTDFDEFLTAIDQAKQHYSRLGFEGTPFAFWLELESNLEGNTNEERKLISQAADDSRWLKDNLSGVEISPEGQRSFAALYRALGDYELTREPKILAALVADLRIKTEHCRATNTRADKTMEFTFNTIDANNNPMKSWVVYARNKTLAAGPAQRIGNPSTPVVGQLIPGRYYFYAEQGNQVTLWEEHVVSQGKIIPPNLLLKFRK